MFHTLAGIPTRILEPRGYGNAVGADFVGQDSAPFWTAGSDIAHGHVFGTTIADSCRHEYAAGRSRQERSVAASGRQYRPVGCRSHGRRWQPS